MNISFIVIGRNEGWKLTKCLDSIFETILYNNIKGSEVIYVDSKSTDDSLKRAKSFEMVKRIIITGDCNAAIARNIGAKEAHGDLLLFIDGDMELDKKFIFNVINNIKYDNFCITGHIDDYLYDKQNHFLGISKRTYKNEIPDKEQILKTNGGIFLIQKKIWDVVGGMRSKYRRGQDNDLTIRLSNIGIKTIRVPVLIAKHHTIDYINEKRMWNDLKKFNIFYPAMLLRNHITNLSVWARELRNNYTAFLMLVCLITFILSLKYLIVIFTIFYFSVMIARITKNTMNANVSRSKFIYFFERMIVQLIIDFLYWLGFFFFYPQPKKIKYSIMI